MRFGAPEVFWLLLIIPLSVLFYLGAFRSKRRALEKFGAPPLMQKLTSATSWLRQIAKAVLVVVGLSFLVLSMTKPQFGTKLELLQRKGVDVVIAFDTSLSMLAEDVRPNRMARALIEIEAFIDRLEGDRVALVAFAGRSFTLCPLTLDYAAAKLFLDVIDTQIIPSQGTAIADAIRTSIRVFGSQERKYKVIVLITDGEDHADDPLEAAREAAREGVRIFVAGIGTPDGELIPVRQGGGVEFLRDRQGNYVKSRLDEETLQEVARISNGVYLRAADRGVGLDRIRQEISEMEKKELGSRKYTQYKHRFQWPLALALICFVFEAVLSDRRRSHGEWRGRFE